MSEQTVAVTFGEGTDGDTWALVFGGLGGAANPYGYIVTVNETIDLKVSYVDDSGLHGWDEQEDVASHMTIPFDEIRSIFVY